MSFSWNNENDLSSQNIIVTGNRGSTDWYSIDSDDLALVGVFNFGAGDMFAAEPLPTLNEPSGRQPRVRVDQKPQPSEGQETFDDDGDVFNDGDAPTRQTVEVWLQSMFDAGEIVASQISSDAGDGPTTYSGFYTTDEGKSFTFSSDGNGNYGQMPVDTSYDNSVF